MFTINPKDVSTAVFHSFFLATVAPRPIAFASTINKNGDVNLSPFSFFNAFSANPPILIFSPARRVKDNSTKHTLDNILEHKEVVINIVNYDIVEQMSLASTEYELGVNEFIKSGLTEIASEIVKPPRVGESPASFECKVKEVISLGDQGGAGNLIVCEVLLAHFKEEILDKNKKIDPYKLDAVARMGGDWYCRAQGEAIFELPKPIKNKGIGVDQIPSHIRESNILTGNNLARLGSIESLPTKEEIIDFAKEPQLISLLENYEASTEVLKTTLHRLAKKFLEADKTQNAWKTLLQF